MTENKFSLRQYMVLGLIATCGPLGDTFLSRGMAGLPSISLTHPVSLVAAIFNPWVAIGIVLLIGFFASYLTALSWADLTFVLPATAFGYVFIALLARFWLHSFCAMRRVALPSACSDSWSSRSLCYPFLQISVIFLRRWNWVRPLPGSTRRPPSSTLHCWPFSTWV